MEKLRTSPTRTLVLVAGGGDEGGVGSEEEMGREVNWMGGARRFAQMATPLPKRLPPWVADEGEVRGAHAGGGGVRRGERR